MDLRQEAFTRAAHLAAVAVTLRRLQQPGFETPQSIYDSLAAMDTDEPSWQQVAALAKMVQSLNADRNVEHDRGAAWRG